MNAPYSQFFDVEEYIYIAKPYPYPHDSDNIHNIPEECDYFIGFTQLWFLHDICGMRVDTFTQHSLTKNMFN